MNELTEPGLDRLGGGEFSDAGVAVLESTAEEAEKIACEAVGGEFVGGGAFGEFHLLMILIVWRLTLFRTIAFG